MIARELRIGNWINLHRKYIKPYVFYERITEGNNIHLIQCGQWAATSIELTAEILSKTGFQKSGVYWYLNNVYIYEWGIVNVSYHTHSIMSQDDDRLNVLEFTSLHQLQNYYYALTGKELEVKL